MWQRTLRRWIWRGNAILLAVLCVLSISYARDASRVVAKPDVSALKLPDRWRPEPAVDQAAFEELIGYVHAFHGRERAKPQPGPADAMPTEPPLRAYGVLLYVRDENGRHGLSLKCKDPSHPRVYHLIAGQSDRGVSLARARFDAKFAYFFVVRGDEAFTFRALLEHSGAGGVIRRVGRSSSERNARDAPTTLASLPIRTAKFVPFHDHNGRAAGVRITGVKPGSWLEKIGVKAGDVLTSWAGKSVLDPRDLLARVEHESSPASVVVTRGVATRSASTLTLRHL